jgi:uncharacterized membrane protein
MACSGFFAESMCPKPPSNQYSPVLQGSDYGTFSVFFLVHEEDFEGGTTMALAMLMLLSVLFAATHIGMSHDPYRARLVDQLGVVAFQVVYTIVSFITLGGAIWIFVGNRKMGPVLWTLPGWLYPLVYLLMLMAFLLLVLSMRTPSPAMMMGGKTEASGVLRVTRHPMNMGLACFALAHVIANGSLGDVFLFGSLFVVGFFGSYHQDKRKAREKGEAYVTFQGQTSIFPFAAVVQGKTRLEAKDFSIPFVVIAVLAFVSAFLFHENLFGLRPY